MKKLMTALLIAALPLTAVGQVVDRPDFSPVQIVVASVTQAEYDAEVQALAVQKDQIAKAAAELKQMRADYKAAKAIAAAHKKELRAQAKAEKARIAAEKKAAKAAAKAAKAEDKRQAAEGRR